MQGVGKSCLVLRYVRGQFDESSKVTVGAAFMSHSVQVQDGTVVKFEIWCAARLATVLPSLPVRLCTHDHLRHLHARPCGKRSDVLLYCLCTRPQSGACRSCDQAP